MLIVTKGCVSHDGLVYKKGQILPQMPRADQQRLLDLGICVEGGAPITKEAQETQITQQVSEQQEAQGSSELNIEFNPNETIVGK